ncbi:hypothetical protein ACJDU8_19305 [Clostridium sp. WILCCON 0269]|uniref:Undecaprenyl-diphosphate phosphatase n=1 Tax=Candidatus Clostridium eludens TaxID=3381663 RepID=A0ABW8SPI4_9CLOT
MVLGAGLLELKDLVHIPISNMPSFTMSILTSAVFGFLSITFLLNYLKYNKFVISIIYRIIAGCIFIAIYFSTK